MPASAAAVPLRALAGAGLETSQADGRVMVWRLGANCALGPRQLAALMGGLAGVSLLISVGFWWVGATLVLPFGCVETLALLLAFVMYARRTQEMEEVVLSRQGLAIRRRDAGGVATEEWPLAWVRVACGPETGDLIEIRSAGRSIRVGRHVAWARRQVLARDMDRALRQANCVSN